MYRSVAEWVKQTEKAGVLDGSYSPPPPSDPPRASSPTLSDASFASNVSNDNCINYNNCYYSNCCYSYYSIVTVEHFVGLKILQIFYPLSYLTYTQNLTV